MEANASFLFIDDVTSESVEQITNGQWPEGVENFFEQCGHLWTNGRNLQLLRSCSAWVLESAYRQSLSSGRGASMFREDLAEITAELPMPTEVDLPVMGDKRQPPLNEAIDATLDRYEVTEKMPIIFREVQEISVLGGSLAHVPFFGVRRFPDEYTPFTSDIDVLAVMDDRCEELEHTSLFTADSVESFMQRSNTFRSLHEADIADEFAHRFHVADKDFNVSVHTLPSALFNDLFGEAFMSDLRAADPVTKTLRSYKQTPFSRQRMSLKGFDESCWPYDLPEQTKIADGYLATIPAYAAQENQYYPGFWHNLVLPAGMILHARDDEVVKTVDGFREKVNGQLAVEKELRPVSSLVSALTRKETFPIGWYDQYGRRDA